MIYLASQSPQRVMLLRQAGIPVTVIASSSDEEAIQGRHPQALALDRARHKAEGALLPAGATGLLIAADTVVALGLTLFGKPADDHDAVRILSALSGTTHAVHTGHHAVRVVDGQRHGEASAVSSAKVTMRPLARHDIDAYIATGEHRGRAGAYAIQATGDRFVTEVQGTLDTVIGLQVAAIARLWRELTDTPLPGYAP